MTAFSALTESIGIANNVWLELAVVCLVVALGGFVKGVIGHGLPLTTVPLLSNLFTVPVALAIVMPAIVLSNAYQAALVGNPGANIKRLWPMIGVFAITIILFSQLLVTLDTEVLLGFVGLISVLFALSQLLGFSIDLPPQRERSTGILVGLIGGIMGGLTSLFSMPFILYLTTLKLEKEDFVNALSLMLFTGSAILMATLARYSIYTGGVVAAGIGALIPLALGYMAGAAVRARLNQRMFMIVIFAGLIAIGIWMMIKGWLL
jgi:uncharacterized membrane protein YfcA